MVRGCRGAVEREAKGCYSEEGVERLCVRAVRALALARIPALATGYAPFALAAVAMLGCLGCSAAPPAPPRQVAPAPPPKDDGSPAQGGEGGVEHAAALEFLKVANVAWRGDRQNSLRLELPDAPHWTRVKFWGVKSLVGYRYGKDHHAIVGGFVLHVDDETSPGVCGKTFEHWAQPWVDSFEVAIEHDPPRAVPWNGRIVDIDSLVARSATLGVRDEYAVVY